MPAYRTRTDRGRVDRARGAAGVSVDQAGHRSRASRGGRRRLRSARSPSTSTPPTSRPGGARPDGETELVVGVEFHSLAPAVLTVPDGEHVLVAGPPRSGRTTALDPPGRLVARRPSGRDRSARSPRVRRSPLLAGGAEAVGCRGRRRSRRRASVPAARASSWSTTPSGSTTLTRLGRRWSPSGVRVCWSSPPAVPTRCASQYGHWTNVIRRSRTGLLMSMCADTDGDVLGELLPRRPPLPPRPGLGWVVGGGQLTLVQVGRVRAVPIGDDQLPGALVAISPPGGRTRPADQSRHLCCCNEAARSRGTRRTAEHRAGERG